MEYHDQTLHLRGFRFERPLAALRLKFGFNEDEPRASFGLFDGYRTPAEHGGDYSTLELEDLLITVAMNSKVGARAAQAFWKGIDGRAAWYSESCRLLSELPRTLELADASEIDLHKIKELFKNLSKLDGVKTAIAGKVLCRKRPRVIPMLDSVVLQIVCDASMESDGVEGKHNDDWRDIDRGLHFLRDLCQDGRQPLEIICRAFRQLPKQPELSPLRAIEALFWWEMVRPEPEEPKIVAYRRKYRMIED